MRDEERIDLYYRSGTLDWRSEMAQVSEKPGKRDGIYGAGSLLKLAALPWLMVQGLVTAFIRLKRPS